MEPRVWGYSSFVWREFDATLPRPLSQSRQMWDLQQGSAQIDSESRMTYRVPFDHKSRLRVRIKTSTLLTTMLSYRIIYTRRVSTSESVLLGTDPRRCNAISQVVSRLGLSKNCEFKRCKKQVVYDWWMAFMLLQRPSACMRGLWSRLWMTDKRSIYILSTFPASTLYLNHRGELSRNYTSSYNGRLRDLRSWWLRATERRIDPRSFHR